MSILPDTNVLINFISGKEPDLSFLKKLLKNGDLFNSPMVIGEYLAKCPAEEERYLQEFLALGKTILIDEEISFVAGKYRQQFSQKAKQIYIVDCFIAATCKIYDLTLITNDLKDYPMKDLKILKPS